MKTIRRNAHRKIAAIAKATMLTRSYSLSNDFVGVPVAVEVAITYLETYDFARLTDHENGKYTVHVHSNQWFYLYTAEYFRGLGRDAYNAPNPIAAPAADGNLTKLFTGLAVGSGAADMMLEWQAGWTAAADEAAAAILAEDAPAPAAEPVTETPAAEEPAPVEVPDTAEALPAPVYVLEYHPDCGLMGLYATQDDAKRAAEMYAQRSLTWERGMYGDLVALHRPADVADSPIWSVEMHSVRTRFDQRRDPLRDGSDDRNRPLSEEDERLAAGVFDVLTHQLNHQGMGEPSDCPLCQQAGANPYRKEN